MEASKMPSRVTTLPAIAAIALVACPSPVARAQDAVAEELKALRQLIERQGKQLETLTAQVARLTARMEGAPDAPPVATPPAAAEPATAPAAETGEFAVPVARPVTPQPAANVHIVVKGDSLEKIAKTHGTTVTELQRINRIADPKKLQIGQQLLLPPPAPKKEGQ
jgi:2',3'-cyclic-nucleotide 2'-phosphodiesterase/3'-nucleotidase